MGLLVRPAGRTSWTDQLDGPAGQTSLTNQLDGPAGQTSSFYLKPWPVRIFEDYPFSLYIVAASESDEGLVFSGQKFFGPKIFFGFKIFFQPKFFSDPNFFCTQIFFRTQIFFQTQIFYWPKRIFGFIFFQTQNDVWREKTKLLLSKLAKGKGFT